MRFVRLTFPIALIGIANLPFGLYGAVVLSTVPELLASAPCPAAAHRLDHCCSYDPYPMRVPLAPTYASAAVGTRSSLES